MTSIITDSLKLMTGRLRPYFLDVCHPTACINGTINGPQEWVVGTNVSDEVFCNSNTSDATLLRDARMSFPSSKASITTFSGFFFIFYVSFVITLRSGQMIRSWCSAGTLLAILIVCAGRVTSHQNHVEDVIFSFLLGTTFAIYICINHLNCFRDKTEDKRSEEKTAEGVDDVALTQEEEDAWFWKYFHIPRVNLLRRSARYFRRRDENIINSNASVNGNAYVNPAFEIKDFDKDLQSNSKRFSTAFHENYST